jgi:hypothetical protein
LKLPGFLLSEESKIFKQSLLALGSEISAADICGVLATKHAGGRVLVPGINNTVLLF